MRTNIVLLNLFYFGLKRKRVSREMGFPKYILYRRVFFRHRFHGKRTIAQATRWNDNIVENDLGTRLNFIYLCHTSTGLHYDIRMLL